MSYILDLTPYKCKKCGKGCVPQDSLSDIWDVYKKVGLCPDCYDLAIFSQIQSRVDRNVKRK